MSKTDLSAHHAEIASLRDQGKTCREVAQALGLLRPSVSRYCTAHGLSRKTRPQRLRPSMPVGRISFQTELEPYQLDYLESEARKYGHKTIAEIALEVLQETIEDAIGKETR